MATSPHNRAALRQAVDEISAASHYAVTLAPLALRGVAHLEDAAYEQLLAYERQAAALGYPVLE